MKRFLRDILIVLSVVVIISIPMDYVLSRYLTKSKAQVYVGWNDIIFDSLKADVLVLGSSRAWVHYDTYIMDSMLHANTYNLGIDGSPLNRQMLKYSVYEHYQRKPPQVLLLNMDYWSVGSRVGYQHHQFFPYLLNEYTRLAFAKEEPFSLGELWLPMYRYYRQGVYSIIDEGGRDDGLHKGYGGRDIEWNGNEFSKVSAFHFSKDEAIEEEFDGFLKELKNQGVVVVFVLSPVYVGLTKIVENLPEFYETIGLYSDRYEIPVLDYFDDSLSYDTMYFYNAMHLNKRGAEMFTVKLCHDLDSLGIFKN